MYLCMVGSLIGDGLLPHHVPETAKPDLGMRARVRCQAAGHPPERRRQAGVAKKQALKVAQRRSVQGTAASRRKGSCSLPAKKVTPVSLSDSRHSLSALPVSSACGGTLAGAG